MELKRQQILIVEDDDDLRAVVGDILSDEGFSVVQAPNGQAALDYLLRTPTIPSLILLDLNMPLMSGREMLGLVRGHRRLAAIPIVIVTSEAPRAGRPEEGAVARLQKPYFAEDLTSLVRQHARRPRRDEAPAEQFNVRSPLEALDTRRRTGRTDR